ncbi:MAG: hypothetical protein UT86_C0005G0077 [Candidatus Magasanikbacteria bacterium GW2011_GWC2_40_17]|uniref:Uncharacterized protein n=1 Tax=Candidatus Magasanikbacteria bacterium GW2011_GWA2_42_32 TaxID=1619039 RepID=A0A0G1D470_9BACT|nr:MAG: hypothetical protein UT86_C0005G0077 [Candidatus Magasanikbacteria bacterium GW2011_GWC2_40_17]KKS56813.1 MAG: hypothetical protein UV20_C0006G0096 [Candidatus Magasanikbacteria bacterium GW2011_GWA2_42_32]
MDKILKYQYKNAVAFLYFLSALRRETPKLLFALSGFQLFKFAPPASQLPTFTNLPSADRSFRLPIQNAQYAKFVLLNFVASPKNKRKQGGQTNFYGQTNTLVCAGCISPKFWIPSRENNRKKSRIQADQVRLRLLADGGQASSPP